MMASSYYEDLGDLVCQLQTCKASKAHLLIDMGRKFRALGASRQAIGCFNRAKHSAPQQGEIYYHLAKIQEEQKGQTLSAFLCYLLASLVDEPVDCWNDLHKLAQGQLNRAGEKSSEFVACALISATILLLQANTKYWTLWQESARRCCKVMQSDDSLQLIVECLCLLQLYVVKRTKVFMTPLHDIINFIVVKVVPKGKQGIISSACHLYSINFSTTLDIKSDKQQSTNSWLNVLISSTPTKIWTIVDAPVLIECLDAIKKELFSGNLCLLITISVLRYLDKEKLRAKEAMMYLDDMLSHGTKTIRFQTICEYKDLGTMEDDVWRGQYFSSTRPEPHHFDMFNALHFYSTLNDHCKYEVWTHNAQVVKFALSMGIGLSKFATRVE